MKTRIYNARVLSMEPDQPIFDGEIWINGDTISYVGPEKTEEKQSGTNRLTHREI